MTEQNIKDNQNRYFSMIPHIAEDELKDTYLSRLYLHYVRVGTCKESTRTTASKTGMSERKVRECRMILDELRYITTEQAIKSNGDFGSVNVTVNDIMEANIYWCKYVKGTPQEYIPRPLQWVLHHLQHGTAPNAGGTAPNADKEEQCKENVEKNTDSSTASAADRATARVADPSFCVNDIYDLPETPAPAVKQRKRDLVFDAVVEHCFGTDPLDALEVQQLGGGRVGRIAKALRKAYAGVLDDQQLAEELGLFAEAWGETELTMPQHEDSVLPNFKKWRDGNTSTPTQAARAMSQPRRVRTECDDPNCRGGYIKTPQGMEKCKNCWIFPEKITA